eukprot:2278892-Rhodomonas_salina.1
MSKSLQIAKAMGPSEKRQRNDRRTETVGVVDYVRQAWDTEQVRGWTAKVGEHRRWWAGRKTKVIEF